MKELSKLMGFRPEVKVVDATPVSYTHLTLPTTKVV